MPVMDGYMATEMIRLNSEFDTLPIVAFTALALESEKQKIFNSGMNAFLVKPLNIGQLYTVFKLFVKGVRPAGELPQHKTVESTNVLDIKAGTRYSNNNEALYLEILKEFMDAYGESAELFEKLVREHRYEQIKMLCLDMKGLTGTIGAKEMYKLILEIQQKVLLNKKEVLVDYTEPYKRELSRLHEAIERYIQSQ
jgi:CheY-like chemotaxis protein